MSREELASFEPDVVVFDDEFVTVVSEENESLAVVSAVSGVWLSNGVTEDWLSALIEPKSLTTGDDVTCDDEEALLWEGLVALVLGVDCDDVIFLFASLVVPGALFDLKELGFDINEVAFWMSALEELDPFVAALWGDAASAVCEAGFLKAISEGPGIFLSDSVFVDIGSCDDATELLEGFEALGICVVTGGVDEIELEVLGCVGDARMAPETFGPCLVCVNFSSDEHVCEGVCILVLEELEPLDSGWKLEDDFTAVIVTPGMYGSIISVDGFVIEGFFDVEVWAIALGGVAILEPAVVLWWLDLETATK